MTDWKFEFAKYLIQLMMAGTWAWLGFAFGRAREKGLIGGWGVVAFVAVTHTVSYGLYLATMWF